MENWISIHRQLPPKNIDVVITHLYWRKTPKRFFSLFVIIAKRFGDAYFDSNSGKIIHEIYEKAPVTHWSPLPILPRPFLKPGEKK